MKEPNMSKWKDISSKIKLKLESWILFVRFEYQLDDILAKRVDSINFTEVLDKLSI